MFKKFLLLFLVVFYSIANVRSQGSDSSMYVRQSKTLYSLLGDRQRILDVYNQSLNLQTGIFGMRSRQDDDNSNAILQNVVKADSDLCVKLNVFLNEVAKDQERIRRADRNRLNSINDLNDRTLQLQQQVTDNDKYEKKLEILVYVLITIIFICLLYLFKKYRRNRLIKWQKV